jgi:hypothetical protein
MHVDQVRWSVRVFTTRAFGTYARKEKLTDAALCEAITRAERGLIDADLGGNVIKQRVARPGQGRSGGYRTLIAFRTQTRAIFLLGFAKNEQDNVASNELKELRKAALAYFALNDAGLKRALDDRKLSEILCHAKKI